MSQKHGNNVEAHNTALPAFHSISHTEQLIDLTQESFILIQMHIAHHRSGAIIVKSTQICSTSKCGTMWSYFTPCTTPYVLCVYNSRFRQVKRSESHK